jgi:hypothetical protein
MAPAILTWHAWPINQPVAFNPGQIGTMLRQRGPTPPTTDLPNF